MIIKDVFNGWFSAAGWEVETKRLTVVVLFCVWRTEPEVSCR